MFRSCKSVLNHPGAPFTKAAAAVSVALIDLYWFYPTRLPHHKWFIFFSRKLHTFSVPYFCAHHRGVVFLLLSVVWVPRLLVTWQYAFWCSVGVSPQFSLYNCPLSGEAMGASPLKYLSTTRHLCTIAVGLGFWCCGVLQEENCSLSWCIQAWSVTWTLWRGLWLVRVGEEK